MNVGYIRVSSVEQNTARQEELMKTLGIKKVFIDKLSGKDSERPELRNMMNYVREGDIVTVESISRFARNTKDLLELIDQLNEKKVQFISQKEQLDTNSATGKFMLTIFGAVAELEREYIAARQSEGIAIAKAEGRFKGRPRKEIDTFEAVYSDWMAKKITAVQASKLCNMARSTFYRRVREYEGEQVIDFE